MNTNTNNPSGRGRSSKVAKPVVVGSLTTLPVSPSDDRHGRMIRYLITNLIRLVCIILCFPVPGWWKLVPAAGAVVLPYVAVVFANAGHDSVAGEVERPGGLEIYRQPDNSWSTTAPTSPSTQSYPADSAGSTEASESWAPSPSGSRPAPSTPFAPEPPRRSSADETSGGSAGDLR